MSQPIFIVAPSRRCGTTLLQRAINSSKEAVIYGENFNFLENYPEMLSGVVGNLRIKIRNTKYARTRVLSGDCDFDASMLYPDYEEYARIMTDHLLRMFRYYERKSKYYGYETWGLKHQIRSAKAFLAFFRFFRSARYIFLYRNIIDAAKSDKARFPTKYNKPENFGTLGLVWSSNVQFMRQMTGNNVLHLDYRDISPPSSVMIENIKQFCGISHMDNDIFQKRINVSPILDSLSVTEKTSNYRAPKELTEAECEALLLHARETCRQLGYDTTL